MLGSGRPAWALPDDASDDDLLRRLAPVGLAVTAFAPLLGLPEPGGDAVRAAALAVTGVAAVAAAVALRLLGRVRDDRSLTVVAFGFAVVAALTAVRGLAAPLTADRDLLLALVQDAAVPALAVPAALGARRAAGAVTVVLLLVAAITGSGTVTGPAGRWRVPGELVTGSLAAASALLWARRAPARGATPHGWVALAVAAPLAGTLVRAVTDPSTLSVTVLPAVGPVLAGAGLGLIGLHGYRRQTRRWRELERHVRAVRSSSPLLPGRAVTPEDDEGLPTRAEVEDVLAHGGVRVALQPVVALDSGRVLGHEALARFGGRVATDRWFRAAAHHGLTTQLERLTVKTALAQLPSLPAPQFLTVNVSPPAMADPLVRDVLLAADLSRVIVEITEHEAVGDYARARLHLDGLRAAGARVAVDDVGAGFASLRHMRQLRPDVVKLDHSLTRGVEHDGAQRALVAALLRFAREVDVAVIGEGVETAEQAAALQELGVPAGQGWHLGVPVLQDD